MAFASRPFDGPSSIDTTSTSYPVSLYDPPVQNVGRHSDRMSNVDLAYLHAQVRAGRWAEQVARVRALASHKKEKGEDGELTEEAKAYDVAKTRALPFALVSGHYVPGHRHSPDPQKPNPQKPNHADHHPECAVGGAYPIVPSGIRFVELDDINDAQALASAKERLQAHPAVVACWRSPGGNGLHVFAVVDPQPTNDAEAHAAYAAVVAELGIASVDDTSVKNLARLAFVSHDPDAYWNPSAIPITWEILETWGSKGGHRAKTGANEPRRGPCATSDGENLDGGKTQSGGPEGGGTDAGIRFVEAALAAMVPGRAGENDNHLLAVMSNLKALGMGFDAFDRWADDAGCTCDRRPRWDNPPSGSQSSTPGWAIVNLAAKYYGFELGRKQPARQGATQTGRHAYARPARPPHVADAALIVKHFSHRVGIGEDLYIKLPSNLWLLIDDSKRARGAMAEIIQAARLIHDSEETKHPTNMDITNAINNLHAAALRLEVPVMQQSDFDQHPILPFTNGQHLHLNAGVYRDCDCDLAAMPTRDWGWTIPAPDWSLLGQTPAVVEHFGRDICSGLSRRLVGPDKSSDTMHSPASNAGKTSLSICMEKAIRGAVKRVDVSTMNPGRLQFSVHLVHLTTSRLVFLDEAGKADINWTQVLYEMTDEKPSVNQKHINEAQRVRIGTPVFIGDQPFTFDSTAQGIPARIGEVWAPRLADGSVDKAVHRHWTSYEQIAMLRVWMIAAAMSEYENYVRGVSTRNRSVRQDMMALAVPDDVHKVREILGDISPANFTPSSELMAMLQRAGISVSVHSGFGPLLRAAYPGAKNTHRPVNGKEAKGWVGLGDE